MDTVEFVETKQTTLVRAFFFCWPVLFIPKNEKMKEFSNAPTEQSFLTFLTQQKNYWMQYIYFLNIGDKPFAFNQV